MVQLGNKTVFLLSQIIIMLYTIYYSLFPTWRVLLSILSIQLHCYSIMVIIYINEQRIHSIIIIIKKKCVMITKERYKISDIYIFS